MKPQSDGTDPDQRLRVALVLPAPAGGGAEQVSLRLLGALDPGLFERRLVLFNRHGEAAGALDTDLAQESLERPRLRQALRPLLGSLRRFRPDVAFSTLGYVNLALLAMRPLLPTITRIVVREANTPSQALRKGPRPVLNFLGYRLLYPSADAVLCQHRKTFAEMQTLFSVAGERLRHLDNPVDIAGLRRRAATPLRRPGPGPRFVVAGRLTAQKGFDRLVSLFAETDRDAHVTIYGSGPGAEALQKQVRESGLAERVAFAGYSTDLPAALAGADACLIPSRWEGMPNVALEALACGTPVIATDQAGGIAELAEQTDAVTVVPWGAPFLSAMTAVSPALTPSPRPSRLPERYDLPVVADAFSRILIRLARPGVQ